MIFNKNTFVKNAVYFFLLAITIIACKPNVEDKEVKALNSKADSLSIKLNSPELKAVNAELLKNPSDPSLYNKRAGIYISLRQLPEAVGDALRAIKLDSTKVGHYHTLAITYFEQNKTRQAKELLEIMEKKFPEDTETLLKLGELYFIVKQYQKGIDYVNKALKINANLAKAYYLKGSIYRESGDTAKAISSFQTAVEQDNKFIDAFFDLGVLYGAKMDPLALEYYNNVLKINPARDDARYARAKLLQDIGKTDEAITEYEAILTKNKNCDNCLYNLGALYLELKKDNNKALDYFTRAIGVNPNYVEAYFARGYTYTKLKDKVAAKADYEMCLKLVPNYEAAVQGLREL
ncbi:MAG: Tetratricopeptide 1 repeat-containing protein [Bacteroidetes bacterium]|jgi:tetratricopeptide (TPR) repeat protein|nr:Tetratricopeptide 1 repeat-containing protein [Bacteroidota bacterium]